MVAEEAEEDDEEGDAPKGEPPLVLDDARQQMLDSILAAEVVLADVLRVWSESVLWLTGSKDE